MNRNGTRSHASWSLISSQNASFGLFVSSYSAFAKAQTGGSESSVWVIERTRQSTYWSTSGRCR
jgi:hypothetical protein